MKTLVSIIGPTAVGKTSVAIEVAKHFSTEIISCDSRQFYKEMKIGTAVPSQEELSAIKHHFVQHLSIEETYSVGDYEKSAIALLKQLFAKYNVLILVGGSALYEKAVNHGLNYFPPILKGVREKINKAYAEYGIDYLRKELRQKDPAYFSKVDSNNPQRMIRALEVCLSSGRTFSSFQQNSIKPREFRIVKIALQLPREQLYQRINLRVLKMMENGLLNEAKELYQKRKYNALQTVGYQELFSYLNGEIDLEKAVALIQQNTRRFAKRQMTWYRKESQVHWFHPKDSAQIIDCIAEQLKKPRQENNL